MVSNSAVAWSRHELATSEESLLWPAVCVLTFRLPRRTLMLLFMRTPLAMLAAVFTAVPVLGHTKLSCVKYDSAADKCNGYAMGYQVTYDICRTYLHAARHLWGGTAFSITVC